MILSDKEIMAAVHAGSLSISPFSESQVQSAGFDFTIGNTFAQLAARENEYIQPGTMPKYKMLTQNRYLLDPGEYILVSTAEYFRFPDDLAALITLRNTYIRLGSSPRMRDACRPASREGSPLPSVTWGKPEL